MVEEQEDGRQRRRSWKEEGKSGGVREGRGSEGGRWWKVEEA